MSSQIELYFYDAINLDEAVQIIELAVGAGNATVTSVNSFGAKTTPVDADVVLIADSADSFLNKKVTWSNIKATLKTYFDTLYAKIFGRLDHGTLSESTEINATTATDHTATLTSTQSITLAGFTTSRPRAALKLTVSGGGTPTLNYPGTVDLMTTQTLSTLADGEYTILIESWDGGTSYDMWVKLKP